MREGTPVKHDIVPRSRRELAPTPRTRIARVIPTSVLPRRPVVRTVRAWLRELFSPPPPGSFLSPSERQLVNTRLHWLVPLRTIGQAAIAMPLAGLLLWILNSIAPGMVLLQVLLGLGAVFHQLWLGYVILRWRADHIIVTDKRLIRISGIVNVTVDAVHLSEITDTTYRRSFIGRILNYGTLVVKSAGRSQSLERMDFVPSPAAIYRATLPHTGGPA